MIPKKIHYCWFGRGEKPELAVKCIESWRKYLQDYEIIEWNEDNFDLDRYKYVREAYDARRFAFVTDVVRLWALYTQGGLYMDTDVEVLKPLDMFAAYEAVAGFEAADRVQTAVIACQKEFPMIKEFLDEYEDIPFIKPDGTPDTTVNVVRITNTCLRHGMMPNGQLQTIDGLTLLPEEYLCPKSWDTGQLHLTENTLCIHHFSGSWIKTPKEKFIKMMHERFPKLYLAVKKLVRGK